MRLRTAGRQRDLGEPPVRLDRVEAGQEVRPPLRHRLHQPRLRAASPRPSGMPAWRCESVDDFGRHLRHALDLDVPSLIVLPIDYSIDVAHLRGARNGDGGRMSIARGQRAARSSTASRSSCSSAASGATPPGATTLAVEDPSTGETLVRGRRRARPTTRWRRSTPPCARAGGVGGAPAARARRDPAPRVRGDHRARRRARAADDARDGQAARRVQGRDHLRRRVPALVLRGGGAHRRPLRGRRPNGAGPRC